ncbi:hypothetical protein NL676_020338 [Syzygium grande]|nr:hypothetical protein NL676_020338 [Syzygium grande]
MGRVIIIFVIVLASVVAAAHAQSASNVLATYNDYNPQQNGWDLNAVHAFCSTWDANEPLAWGDGWITFCSPVGPSGEASCGCCLRDRSSNDSEDHRPVQQRRVGLYIGVFQMLDTDGSGYAQGHLIVDYQFITF